MTEDTGARPRPRWDLVALAVRYRREQLAYRVDDIAAHVGVTPDAWRTLEGGRRPSGFHKEHAAAASAALGWTPESLDRIVRGHRPLDAPGSLPTLSARAAPPTIARSAPPTVPRSAPGAVRPFPTTPAHSAPWFLAPISTKGPDGVRSVDPARLGLLGGLVILGAVIVVFFVR
jgi:hypothetical protein